MNARDHFLEGDDMPPAPKPPASATPENIELPVVNSIGWLGHLRAEVAAGLREARRHMRICQRDKLTSAWAHRKGEVAALRGVARLLHAAKVP